METFLANCGIDETFEIVVNPAALHGVQRHCILMTHGIFTDRDEKGRFTRLAARLSNAGFDVARFDFRGHGNRRAHTPVFSVAKSVADYVAAIESLQLRNYSTISIIGSSFGASICLLERLLPIQRKILAFAFLNPVTDYQRNFLQSKLEWAQQIFSRDRLDRLCSGGSIELQPGFFADTALLTELATMTPFGGIEKMAAPSLILHGDADDKIALETSVEYFSANADSRLEIVKNAGHAFKDDWAEEFAHGTITDWLSKAAHGKHTTS